MSHTKISRHQEENEDFNLKTTIEKYLRNWKLFAAAITLALITAAVVNEFTPPLYKIESKFLIKEESNALNLFDPGAIAGHEILPKGQKIANDMIKLKSRAIAGIALDQLHFDVEYYSEGLFVPTEIYQRAPMKVTVDWHHPQLTGGDIRVSWKDAKSFTVEFPEADFLLFDPAQEYLTPYENTPAKIENHPFDEWVDSPLARFQVTKSGLDSAGTILIRLRDRESLLAFYTGESLEIFPVDKLSSIVTFSLETTDPQKGRDYLNTLMKVFLDDELNEKNAIARNTIRFIDTQLTGISDSLSNAGTRLERFRSSHRTYNISTEGSSIFEKLSELEKLLSEQRFKKKYYQNLNDYLARESYSEIVAPSGLGIDDNVLNKLIGDLILLQSDKSRFLATQTENSPAVKEVSRKLTDLTSSIKEVLRNVDRNADLMITDLQARIQKIESQFGSLPQTEQELVNIQRKYTLNENIYSFLLQKRAESAIMLASNTASNKIVDAAVLNFLPMKLRPFLNYFLALLLGVLLPILVLYSQDVFSKTITDINDAKLKLNVPVLGVIGQRKHYPQLVVLKEPRASITESFRALRTNINFIITRTRKVVIMVTSSVAGEGKTFCAINLASVYSLSGKRTLLVECDMRKPFAPEGLDITNDHGLSTILSGQVANVKDVIRKSGFPDFDILPPGPIPPNPSELLINERFEQVIEELKGVYDVIILDSSPVGITNETLHLTKLSDFALFIMRQHYSNRSFVNEVNSLKEEKDVKNLYVVFNDVASKHMKNNGYGYGYYSEDKPKTSGLKTLIGNVRRVAM